MDMNSSTNEQEAPSENLFYPDEKNMSEYLNRAMALKNNYQTVLKPGFDNDKKVLDGVHDRLDDAEQTMKKAEYCAYRLADKLEGKAEAAKLKLKLHLVQLRSRYRRLRKQEI